MGPCHVRRTCPAAFVHVIPSKRVDRDSLQVGTSPSRGINRLRGPVRIHLAPDPSRSGRCCSCKVGNANRYAGVCLASIACGTNLAEHRFEGGFLTPPTRVCGRGWLDPPPPPPTTMRISISEFPRRIPICCNPHAIVQFCPASEPANMLEGALVASIPHPGVKLALG
jgi:hypothetical protein